MKSFFKRMTRRKERMCGNCSYFHGREHDGCVMDGECRRYPPAVTQHKYVEDGLWPKFDADHDPCGEYLPM